MVFAPTSCFLVDASIYIFRAYFALPERWHTQEGDSVHALYGYTRFLLELLIKHRPQYIVVAHDESLGSCFRNAIYPDYKASRVLPDPALAFQLEACKGLTDILGITTLASERYEADDLIATLAAKARQQGLQPVIVSRDKDLGQLLLAATDRLWDGTSLAVDSATFCQQFGVQPVQVADYLALVGDPVDDIPGVPGIGKTTAMRLLQRFGNLPAILAALPQLDMQGVPLRGLARVRQSLLAHAEQALMSLQLASLCDTVPLSETERRLARRQLDVDELYYYLEAFGLAGAFSGQLRQLASGE